jgi:hypothetical protein
MRSRTFSPHTARANRFLPRRSLQSARTKCTAPVWLPSGLPNRSGYVVIVSIHIAKTAGTTFGRLLQIEFGDRLLLDYGDWVGFNSSEAIARRRQRAAETRTRRAELTTAYGVIHGHFVADKYLGLFPSTDWVAFFRDPYQQAISTYQYLLNNPQIEHPGVCRFHQVKPSLSDFCRETADPQTGFLGSLSVAQLTMIGIAEEFPRSVLLFNKIFGRRLSPGIALNVNHERPVTGYELAADTQRAIGSYRGADIALYREARERFIRLLQKYDL